MILVWLCRAIIDRKKQLDYIAQDSFKAAIEQGKRIDHNIDQLTHNPELGRLGRKQNTRELVISRTKFIAVYRISGKYIEVLRLLHTSQQWPKQ